MTRRPPKPATRYRHNDRTTCLLCGTRIPVERALCRPCALSLPNLPPLPYPDPPPESWGRPDEPTTTKEERR